MIRFLVSTLVANVVILYAASAYVFHHYNGDPTILISLWMTSWMTGNVAIYFLTQELYKDVPEYRYFRFRRLVDEDFNLQF